jgi:hypothetical protein
MAYNWLTGTYMGDRPDDTMVQNYGDLSAQAMQAWQNPEYLYNFGATAGENPGMVPLGGFGDAGTAATSAASYTPYQYDSTVRHFDAGGQNYISQPLYSGWTTPAGNTDAGGDSTVYGDQAGYRVYRDLGAADDSAAYNLMPYDDYGMGGEYLGSNQFNINTSGLNAARTIMQLIAVAGLGGGALAATGGIGGTAGAAAAPAGAGSVGGAGGFVGEGALSGVGAWDGALAASPSWTAAGGYAGGAAGTAGSGGGGSGFTFNPALDSQAANQAMGAEALSGYTGAPIPSVTVNGVPGGGSWLDQITSALTPSPGSTASSALGQLTGGGGSSNLLGLGSSLLGGLSGAQGQQGSASSTRTMDPRLDQPVYGAGGLVPLTQQALAGQFPQAQQYGNQLMSTGSGLVGSQIPTGPENPYLAGIADDIQRRVGKTLSENNQAIQGRAIGVGGLGGSRQGVAQGVAAGQAADNLSGQLSNLFGTAYNSDMNRQLQRIGLGSGLISQGQGLQFQPLKDTSGIYGNFTGMGTTTQNTDSGGGLSGLLGGALAGASFGRQMNWW